MPAGGEWEELAGGGDRSVDCADCMGDEGGDVMVDNASANDSNSSSSSDVGCGEKGRAGGDIGRSWLSDSNSLGGGDIGRSGDAHLCRPKVIGEGEIGLNIVESSDSKLAKWMTELRFGGVSKLIIRTISCSGVGEDGLAVLAKLVEAGLVGLFTSVAVVGGNSVLEKPAAVACRITKGSTDDEPNPVLTAAGLADSFLTAPGLNGRFVSGGRGGLSVTG